MLAFLLSLSSLPPLVRAFQLQFQRSLATKAGFPEPGCLRNASHSPHYHSGPLICLHSWLQDCARGKVLGGGPAFSVACWEMGSLHKEFPNKRHQYYLCSHQTAWGTIWLWLGHMLSPQVLCEGLVGSPQTHLGPECQCIEKFPSSSPVSFQVSHQTQFIQVGQWVDSNWQRECPGKEC